MMSLGLKDSPFSAVQVAACQRGGIGQALVHIGCLVCLGERPPACIFPGKRWDE